MSGFVGRARFGQLARRPPSITLQHLGEAGLKVLYESFGIQDPQFRGSGIQGIQFGCVVGVHERSDLRKNEKRQNTIEMHTRVSK